MVSACIVIDDEPLARSRMVRLLSQLDDVTVVAQGDSGREAIELVSRHSPEIIFMDVEMPGINGVDAAKIISDKTQNPPAIVFCTAFEEFAVDAFQASAVAYLLKPVSREDLGRAISQATKISKLQLNNLAGDSGASTSIGIGSEDHLQRLDVERVVYFRSEQKLTWAGIDDGSETVADQTLKELLERYQSTFLRVHRNAIINSSYLSKLVKNEQSQTVLELFNTSRTFLVSRRHLNQVKKSFR